MTQLQIKHSDAYNHETAEGTDPDRQAPSLAMLSMCQHLYLNMMESLPFFITCLI